MIKLGNKDITNIKIGDLQVSKVYQGDNIVWQKNQSSFAVPILDLDFQNNITDKSGNYKMTGSNLPTFGLSGRKSGEYCANFNGSQSIRTNEKLLLNSDKVAVSFWIKTNQTSTGVVAEIGQNYINSSSFGIFINDIIQNKIELADSNQGINIVNSNENINTENFHHVIIAIDRSQGINQNKIYINGYTNFTQSSQFQADNIGNFPLNVLNIGRRATDTLGFVGSLIALKVYNQVPTDAQAMEIYQNEL